MSGVEAAGIALAVFPLLISALEHYRESAEVLGDWWKFKRKYVKCKRDIEYHHITYTQNLQELLLPLIVDDDEVEDLVNDPGGAKWKDPSLEASLKDRLPNTYEAYLDSMSEISTIMTDLRKELGLDNDQLQARVHSGEGTSIKRRSTKESLGYQGQRIKFALGQTTRDKLLDEFAKYNGRLRDLLRTGDKISAIKKANKAPKMGAVLTSLWRHAKALYESLFDSWGCECRDGHRADLLLCHRDTASDINFEFLLLFARDASHLLWGWQNASAKVTEPSPSPSKVSSLRSSRVSIIEGSPRSPAAPSALMHKTATFPRPSILSRASKTSTFSSSTSTLMYSHSRNSSASIVGVKWTDTQSTIVDESEALVESVATPAVVTELCSHLSDQAGKDVTLANVGSDIQYCLETTKTAPCDLVGLDSLLDTSSNIPFPRRQRYHLAHVLASSQAQLHSTPWLKNEWRRTDVLFTKNKSEVAVDQPRLTRDFSVANDGANEDHSVASLGMLLLELCFGKLLEDHPIRRSMPVMSGPQNFYLDLAAALQWSEQVVDEAGPAYAGAVKWCLSQSTVGTKDEKWRAELYENVVKPLQECHDHLR
jgi:hypothetical protein